MTTPTETRGGRQRPLSRPLDETAIEFVVNGTAMRLDSVEDEVEAVRRMAVRGLTTQDAADRLQLPFTTVQLRAKEAGVTMASPVEPAHWSYDYSSQNRARAHRRAQRMSEMS